MTNGEWELGELLRSCIIHIEMDEFLESVSHVDDSKQRALIQRIKDAGNLPSSSGVEEKRLLRAAAEYLAVEEIQDRYLLDAATIETYPYAWGLGNLAASWLADEGFVLETEGDLVRTTLMCMLNELSPSPSMLGELADIDPGKSLIYIGHAGSTALSLAQNIDEVRLTSEGEVGCFVQFPLKELDKVTLVNLWKDRDSYKMFAGLARSRSMGIKEWEDMGAVSLAKLEVEWDIDDTLAFFILEGMEHHFLVAAGDLREDLVDLAELLGIRTVSL